MIRPIQEGDLDALLELCAEHADYEHLPFQNNGQKLRWQKLFFQLPPKIHVWVFECDGSIQGYMSVTIDYSTWGGEAFAYMDCLYLRTAYRGNGIGRTFIETLRQFAQTRGCTESQWHTPPHNELGLKFYRSIGAQEKTKIRYFLATDGE